MIPRVNFDDEDDYNKETLYESNDDCGYSDNSYNSIGLSLNR